MKDYSDYETQRAILLEYLQVMVARAIEAKLKQKNGYAEEKNT
jgi:hypothetical protein